jgi:hypothetical protein
MFRVLKPWMQGDLEEGFSASTVSHMLFRPMYYLETFLKVSEATCYPSYSGDIGWRITV